MIHIFALIGIVTLIGLGGFSFRIIRWVRFNQGKSYWYRPFLKSGTCHKCGICKKLLYDKAGDSALQDYECSGHYKFQFDCGMFECHVGGVQVAHFYEDQSESGFANIKLACQQYVPGRTVATTKVESPRKQLVVKQKKYRSIDDE
jgi:hypothetical protein